MFAAESLSPDASGCKFIVMFDVHQKRKSLQHLVDVCTTGLDRIKYALDVFSYKMVKPWFLASSTPIHQKISLQYENNLKCVHLDIHN